MNGYRPICNFCGSQVGEDEEVIVAHDESAAICEACVGIAVIAIEEAYGEDMPSTMIH